MTDIRYEIADDGIALLTLSRPEQMNAMTARMATDLMRILDDIDADPAVRVVILHGEGRAFCAGADLSAGPDAFSPLPGTEQPTGPRRDWGGMLVLRLFALSKPIIAAVNGAAVGVGATITLPCDIRMASSDARFGFVFARRGIVTDGCASWFLPRVVGIGTAMEWCITGRLISADAAMQHGLIRSVHDAGELLGVARELALEIAANTSAVSVSLTRRLLWQGLIENHPMTSHNYESALIGFTSASPDAREGVGSFLEKRPPMFSGQVPGDLPETWPYWDEPSYEAVDSQE